MREKQAEKGCAIDVLCCPTFGGRMLVIAVILDQKAIREVIARNDGGIISLAGTTIDLMGMIKLIRGGRSIVITPPADIFSASATVEGIQIRSMTILDDGDIYVSMFMGDYLLKLSNLFDMIKRYFHEFFFCDLLLSVSLFDEFLKD